MSNQDRNMEIYILFKSKMRQKVIAYQYGISVRWVKHIIHEVKNDTMRTIA